MKMNVTMKTILMLIGPTECGKTTFAQEILIPQLNKHTEGKEFRTNVQYLSSDAIRQELLGHTHDKYDAVMTECSEQAFEILFTKLNSVTKFPINADFVIVDTTGLSETFRNRVLDISKENHYQVDAVLFDYKNVNDYYSSTRSKKLIATHTNRLRKDVLPSIRKDNFHTVHRIKAKDFFDADLNSPNPDYVIDILNYDDYLSHILPQQYEYVIIGDIHEQTADLVNLVTTHGFIIKDGIMTTDNAAAKRFVLVGDLIDKGGDTKGIIEFITQNRKWFYIVKGNHENFVSKFLRGEIKEKEIPHSVLEEYFTAIPSLTSDKELKQQFFNLVDSSKDFYRFIGISSPSFYVTHSPCKNKYIGKLDSYSRKQQRKFATIHDEPLEQQLNFLTNEAVGNHPYHVFGHVATQRNIRIRNKIGVDTGCVHGNTLTSVEFIRNRPVFKSVASTCDMDKELPIIFVQKKSIKVDELEDQDLKRLNYVLKNKVNFISGTMSPSDKDMENEELESLRKGLDYFKSSGVKEVILQPKYMGSRCNIYLSQKLDECYAVSRNGYKITRIDLTGVFKTLQEQHRVYMEENKIDYLLLDGELLPWRILGEELIHHEFEVVSKSIESELDFLTENGFNESFNELVETYKNSNFDYLEVKSTKKDLAEQFGHSTYNTYRNLKEVLKTYVPINTHKDALSIFQEQLAIYGEVSEAHFKAFSILKMKISGKELLPKMNSSDMFKILSSDDYLVLSFEDEEAYRKAKKFFDEVTTNRKMEGIVIKPEVLTADVAPYMKVRNPDYLTIVYGYDYQFPHKMKSLLTQKNISKKLRTSISEHRLGQEMLEFEHESIRTTNIEYQQVVANLLFETQKEKEIDPRL